MTMRVMTTADDFGYSEDTVQATIECFEDGSLRNASIMANMTATQSAIEYAVLHPEHSFGVHLTFIGNAGERPLLDPGQIPHLVDSQGVFLPGREVFVRAMLGQLPVDEIRREMHAQISLLRDHGVRLSYADSHGHSHKLRPFIAALREVLPHFGIQRVRRGQNVWLTKPYRSPTFWVGGAWHPRVASYFTTTDKFFMPTSISDAESLMEVLCEPSAGTLEIGVHPGFEEPWRDSERRALQALRAKLVDLGHAAIGWEEV